MAIEPKGHRLLARWEWRLSFCTAVFLFVGSEVFAQQATPLDFTAAIRTVSGLNADGLESKSFRDEYCKPLPAEKAGLCRNHMETIADSRRRLDLAMNAVEDAAKKGPVDLKILQRLDAQVAAYISIRNFIYLWLEDK
jgi:hypothetical protein